MPLLTSGPSSSSHGSLYSVQLTLRQEVMSLPLPCHCCIHQVLSVSEGHFTFPITVSMFILINHVMLVDISELEKE